MLTVNCFSPTFSRLPSSVAFQTPEHIQYVWEHMEFDGITFFTDGLVNNRELVKSVKCPTKIGWLREPRCLYPHVYEESIQNRDLFDFILTYDKDLIDLFPQNYRYVIYGGVWIDKGEWGLRRKTKDISMLFGDKDITAGHQLRHQIFEHIGYQPWIDYYGKYGTPTDYSAATKLKVLKDYRFSIVVETCREEGLFTEILLDCFAVGTIPIFWGAPDIGDYFYRHGILSFETLDDLDQVLEESEDYRYYVSYALENLHRVEQYAVTEDWISERYLKRLST